MGILSGIGKFLFGGTTKTTSATSSGTTDVDPYAPVIPAINDYISKISGLYEGTPMFSDLESQGYDALAATAASGQGDVTAAIAKNNETINGDFLTPDTNPYLADIATRISGIAGAQSAGMFGGKGRSSGGLAGYYSGKAVGDSLTDLYGQNYEAERGRQQQAIGQAPGLAQAAYTTPQALISAGQNVSARPFDIAQQQGGILAQIGRLGQQGTTSGQQQNYTNATGMIPSIANSFTNKLFGTTLATG